MAVDEVKNLFSYFETNDIVNRTQLRFEMGDILKLFPDMNQQLVEGYFSKYKQSSTIPSDKIVVASDFHIPFHSVDLLKAFVTFLKDYKPTMIILNGDIVDFYDLSRFDKDPKRIGVLQTELDIAYSVLYMIKASCPDSKLVYVKGNHEDRLKKFLWKNPSISSLRDLELERLLRLEDFGNIELVEEYSYQGKVLFTHGDLVRKHSGYSAKAEFEKSLTSGVSGHTHRLGSHYVTTGKGNEFWIESGCMCKTNASYIKGVPNWQNGFVVIETYGELINPLIVRAIDNRFIFNNKFYS